MQALGPEDGAFFAAQYDVTAGGQLRRPQHPQSPQALTAQHGEAETPAEDSARLAMLRGKLLQLRENRVRPGLDDKVLADWNGLMIAALANGGALLGEPGWIDMATRAFGFIAADMTRGDRLGHSWRDGRLLFPGLASDFACMIKAALALYEATGERSYLDQRARLAARARPALRQSGQWRLFPHRRRRRRPGGAPAATNDDATPNPNAIAAANLVRLAVLAGDDAWRDAGRPPVRRRAERRRANLIGHAALLNALDLRLRAAEIVVTGSGARADALLAAARKLSFLDRIVLHAPTADALPGRASGARQDRGRAARRSLRLRRRALLPAGGRRGATGGDREGDARLTTSAPRRVQ